MLVQVEMALQAEHYEQIHPEFDLSKFFKSADKHVRSTGIARRWLDTVMYDRSQRHASFEQS